jgi:hypothetical protein
VSQSIGEWPEYKEPEPPKKNELIRKYERGEKLTPAEQVQFRREIEAVVEAIAAPFAAHGRK